MTGRGFAGRLAKAFINSKLTPILVLVSLLLGIFAVVVTPREEEPQIVVPMLDVMLNYPGATAAEVENRVTKPMEQLLWEIPGVEYVYSIVKPGSNLTIVRFRVGENQEDSLVRLYNKLMSNYDRIPQGVSQPLIKARAIDDVPVFALTLWSDKGLSSYELRRVAVELSEELKKDEDVAEINVIGGQKRQIRIEPDPNKLAAYQLPLSQLGSKLIETNTSLAAGSMQTGNREFRVEAGKLVTSPREIENIVVGVYNHRPVYVKQVAKVTDGPGEISQYVFMDIGPAASFKQIETEQGSYEAVTLSLAKKKGANATVIAERALAKAEALHGKIVPRDVQMTVTRNYGETAKEKSDELLEHMLIATVSVVLLIGFVLGWREAGVVGVAVPVTLALTLLISYLLGYTLNRVTLFALIFSIGILVDDAIVVVENIHRRFVLAGRADEDTAAMAVDEVGNPTILATFTVIAALLPMAFVSGLMGPYMRPIPVGASAAMLFSLLVAFIVSPWLGYRLLKKSKTHQAGERSENSKIYQLYAKVMTPLINNNRKRHLVFAGIVVLLGLAVLTVPLKGVTVKMLPFDNKSELQVIIDMPEDSTLEQTAAVAKELGSFLKTVPEVTDFETYVGTAAPYNFNGLVRHYFQRSGSSSADIQINFVNKGERVAQSHDIAKRLRPSLQEIGQKYGARIKLAEIPPGPPVMSTLVAEVYGPDGKEQLKLAKQIRDIFKATPGVVDIDWYVEDDQPKVWFIVDREKTAAHGISVEAAAKTLNMAMSGFNAGQVHMPEEKEPVDMLLRFAQPVRSEVVQGKLAQVFLPAQDGRQIPLSQLVTERAGIEEKTIYHKNLQRVTYVIGDVAGSQESPVYAIMKMKEAVGKLTAPGTPALVQYSAVQPWLEDKYAMKWDGEWHITFEVFRDLGIAFAAVLLLIYVLVVAWFRSFLTPLVIMAPIPLTLVGILPGHWLFGAFFTATSMIGFIALSGIIVRNSILLIDFVEIESKEQGMEIRTALIEAGAVRLRPIVLTAAAVVVGSFVMLFDPIFQGLAIAMMFGAIAATGLTLLVVPLLYFELFGKNK